jgi:hypothetical protein
MLGARVLGEPDWPPGSVIHAGPNEPNLRVVKGCRHDETSSNHRAASIPP